MPIIIDETEVHLDFNIYAILEFELLIGHPLDNLFQEKPSHGSLSEQFGKTASATHLDNPMAKRCPNNDPSEEVKFISPFISPRLSSETKYPLPTLLKHKPCPSGHKTIVLNNDAGSTLFPHDISLENKSFYAMDILLSATCLHEDHNHLLILVSKLFKRMVVDAFVYHKYCKSRSCIMALTLQLERKCSIPCGEAGN
jgi:hypothetical protein